MSSIRYSNVVKNIDNIAISNNEAIIKYVLNRNIRKLVENDENLQSLYREINGNIFINDYIEGQTYNIGDIVWFRDEELEELKLLRCIRMNNTQKPYYKNGSYDQTGWYDENGVFDMDESGLYELIVIYLRDKISSHQNNTYYHPYGKMGTDRGYLDSKFMLTSLSNRNVSRKNMLYPHTTHEIPPSNTILNGFYRQYDNGYVEYDIVYRLGFVGEEYVDGVKYQQLTCNDLDIEQTSENKHFVQRSDRQIFKFENTSSNNYSIVGDTIQRNRNDYVNVYSAQIDFPVSFVDTDYIIYSSSITSQDNDTQRKKMVPCSNQVIFVDRTVRGVCAMMMTFPSENFNSVGYNTQNGGLVANSFRCKIMGFVNT